MTSKYSKGWIMQYYLRKVSILTLLLSNVIHSQITDNLLCDCMEYWHCIGQGGAPYTYCDYSHKVCCFLNDQASDVGILPRKGKLGSCGQKGTDSNKRGVSEAGEWAWHAAILEKPLDLYVCGGSLVDEYWILTAAHCVDDYVSAGSLKIRLGEHDVSALSELHPHEEYDVSDVIIHPEFNNESLINDVALLRLTTPARRRSHINVVCLPQSPVHEKEVIGGEGCYITGWGRNTENSSHSLILKEIKVPIWRQQSCESALQLQFGTEYTLPETSLCAGAKDRDACDGDGGGPLVCSLKSRWYQIGVISFGVGCGRRNVPGVYTRVQSFSTWIHETVLLFG